jgi:diguanylate cyclase (GGDEF)-like protein
LSLKNRVIGIICILLFGVSIAFSIINYVISLKNTDKQLKDKALPLSIDNIYTEIQQRLIEPNLVSSMMANDTFVKNWLKNGERNTKHMIDYLKVIKNRYGMFTTFLVSDKTRHYYHPDGIIDIIEKNNPDNAWYFKVKQMETEHEVNLDFNTHISKGMIMFINYKILDGTNFLGATGIGINISYIHNMLKRFRETYQFNVYFSDSNGQIVLSERSIKPYNSIFEISGLKDVANQIFTHDTLVNEYISDGETYLLNTKFIPELNLFLFVEAKMSDFTEEIKKTFYGNLLASLIVAFAVIGIIVFTLNIYQRQLENLAAKDSLTGLDNRRTFDAHFRTLSILHQRNKEPLSAVIFDIDNFKIVNDTYGHLVGDSVLVELAKISASTLRESDVLARWGGEEFALLLPNTSQEEAFIVCEKLRKSISQNEKINRLIDTQLTISLGISELAKDDTITTLFHRADEALYQAKNKGKNQTVIAARS